VCCEKEGKLSGTWYRDLDGVVISATFAGDELTLCIKRCENGHLLTFTLSADYAVTKDGTVHGVVTGADVKFDRESKVPGLTMSTAASISAELQATVDCPFAFRIRRTTSGLIVSNLKLTGEAIDKEALAMACGRFKYAADGKLPPVKATSSERSCETPTLLSGRYLKHYQQYFPPEPPQPLPRDLASREERDRINRDVLGAGKALPTGGVVGGIIVGDLSSAWLPLRPANVPAGEFGMMADVFVKMLGAKPQPMPVPTLPATHAGSSATAPPMPIPTPPRIERPR
jgi:hypothetical protein